MRIQVKKVIFRVRNFSKQYYMDFEDHCTETSTITKREPNEQGIRVEKKTDIIRMKKTW